MNSDLEAEVVGAVCAAFDRAKGTSRFPSLRVPEVSLDSRLDLHLSFHDERVMSDGVWRWRPLSADLREAAVIVVREAAAGCGVDARVYSNRSVSLRFLLFRV